MSINSFLHINETNCKRDPHHWFADVFGLGYIPYFFKIFKNETGKEDVFDIISDRVHQRYPVSLRDPDTLKHIL